MRLLDDESNRPINKAWVFVTESEARELAEALYQYFSEDDRTLEWHCHVESQDGRAKELTLALYDSEAPSGNEAWQRWFNDDQWTPGMFGDSDNPDS